MDGPQTGRVTMRWKIAGLSLAAALLTAFIQFVAFLRLYPDALASDLTPSVLAGLGAAGLAAAAGFVFATRISRPLERLLDAAAAIADGDLTVEVGSDSTREVAELAASFAAMTAG